jgi:transcriptional regulator with XRE-family HTH domain
MNIPYILARLKELNLTQSKIAAEVGCSQPTISEMAAGKTGTTRPSHKTITGIQALAEKHRIPLDPPVPAPARPARACPTVPD